MKRTFTLMVGVAVLAFSGGAYSVPPFCADEPDRKPCQNAGEEAQGNNLSFPALAVDDYPISPIEEEMFEVPYDGDYPGLTPEQIAALGDDYWYPQKTEGNTWQADYLAGQMVEVSYVDWGDNIEAVNPKVGRPFRLEIQLYRQLNEWPWDGTNGMTGYVMAELEYPSSLDELQGTNTVTYEGNFATVVSNLWKLRIQYCGSAIPDDLYWDVDTWVSSSSSCDDIPISFAVENNVGGKLIFGGSQGGWKPKNAGWYRITFYSPVATDLSLVDAEVGNYADFSVEPVVELLAAESDEGDEGAATPIVDGLNNISYVDVEAVASGGVGGGGGKPDRP
jgi:hypothetical protein